MAATIPSSPADYDDVLETLQGQVRTSRIAAMTAANAEMLALYRTIGRTLQKQQHSWAADAVHRLEADLRAEFPDMTGLSQDNLEFMRRFAAAWPDPAAGPDVAALPWGHIRILLAQVTDAGARDLYAAAALAYGWSQNDLVHHIEAASDPAVPPTAEAKARVRVDFHLSPDGQTLAAATDVSPRIALAGGDVVEAHDGDVARLAVVDSVDDAVLSLVILWDGPR